MNSNNQIEGVNRTTGRCTKIAEEAKLSNPDGIDASQQGRYPEAEVSHGTMSVL